MIHTKNNTFVISDLHFFHGNIVKFCKRPYSISNNDYEANKAEQERMTEDLLKEFDKLPKDSVIYNLGDLFFPGTAMYKHLKDIDWLVKMRQIVNRMKDNDKKVYLIKGNHDTFEDEFYYSLGIDRVYDSPIIVNENVILSHEPVYISKDSNFVNYYGHTHDVCIDEKYFTYKNDLARIHKSLPTFPERLIDTSKYVNCCWDYNHSFLELIS